MNYNVASCGLGVNSIAALVEATHQGIIFNKILFANTGKGKKLGERLVTYDYLIFFSKWLQKHGQPAIKMLHSKNKNGEIVTLYEECYKLKTLPSIVFGSKSCSQRFKTRPQENYLSDIPECKRIWVEGGKVTKWIFYDVDEEHRIKQYEHDLYENNYYLVNLGWGRYECEEKIKQAGLPLPPKSACKFCPSTKPYQIIELYEESKAEFYEAIALERNALEGNKMTAIKGLGRDWSWWDLIKAYRYINIIKRYGYTGVALNSQLKKMIRRVHTSKPRELRPQSERTTSDICSTLFTTSNEVPCECVA